MPTKKGDDTEGRSAPSPGPDVRPLTLLHLSDPQFGKNHRFAQQDLSGWDAPFETLLARLQEDLAVLQNDPGLEPDLVVVTGDLAEWGLKSEFEDALRFLRGVCELLKLPPGRVAIIPGNHDINRSLCEGYFFECKGDEREPAFPYWPKWKPYVWFFQEFYGDTPGAEFTEDLPWSFFEMADLKVVVAGLNSTMQESHRDDDHCGQVGEKQLQWFRQKLEPYRQQGWLRIGAVHHNFRRGATRDDENLKDADNVQRVLGRSLNLLLHGHTHEGKLDWITPSLPILSTGSAALKPDQRPSEVPNQYQIVRIWPDRICRWTRGFAPDQKRWIGDTRTSEDGSQWWSEETVTFATVEGTFPSTSRALPPLYPADLDAISRPDRWQSRRDDFLDRVQAVCQLRMPEAQVERITGIGDWGDYLRVSIKEGGIATISPVGALDQGLSETSLQLFLSEVDARYRRSDPQLRSTLVYGGEPAPEPLVRLAQEKRVHLQSFIEFQGLIDFRPYIEKQTAKLGNDPVYPPKLYVPQRLFQQRLFQSGGGAQESPDALSTVQEWLSTQAGRFVVLLGDFGTGKTFLLHELARRMGEQEGGLIPILLQMRSLEKGRDLNALLAQHFAVEGVEDFSPTRFRYMLEQGRIALLFDGFDELALRVTYDRATEHFDTLLQAATGAAKVVLTSRRQHFLSDQQVKTILAERAESVPGHRLAILQPFDRDQIRAFLVNFCGNEELADRRLNLIEHIRDLLGLSHNPRLLSFIAELPDDQLLAAAGGDGEITAAGLYELLLQRWLVGEFDRVHPKGTPLGLSVEERWRGVTVLALRLWQKTDASVGLADLTEDAARVIAALDPTLAAFQLGSGTLLVRDEDGNFSFLHQSILEWLVARDAAEELKAGRSPESLTGREMSPLMADFFASLATRPVAVKWARSVLHEDSGKAINKNALLVLERLGEKAREPALLAGQDLRGKDLSYQDLTSADLTGADLTGARLIETRLGQARLVEAKLVGADLSGAVLAGADLSEADLTGARLLGADLQDARLDGTELRRAKLLAALPGPQIFEDCDTFGAALSLPRPLDGLVAWAGGARALAWSPEGDLLATAEGTVVRLWEVSSGNEIRQLSGHSNSVRSVAFSPDGQTLASASHDNTVRLWNVSSGNEVRQLSGHDSRVLSVAFSPDGQTLASGSDDNTIRLWNVSSGNEIRRLSGHNQSVLSVAFSPNGQTIASASYDNTVRIWQVSSGNEIQRLTGHDHSVRSVAFSPDGQTLASASDDKTGRLWNVSSGNEVRRLSGHSDSVLSVAFSPDGQILASGSDNETVRLWQVASGTEIRQFKRHAKQIWGVAFSPDGQTLASSSEDNTVRLWQVSSGTEIRRLKGQQGWALGVAFSPDGRSLASGSEDKVIHLWQVSSGTEIRQLKGHDKAVSSVTFSPDGQTLASGSFDNTVRLWQISSGTEIQQLSGHNNKVLSVAFSPDGQILASGSQDNTVRIWKVSSGNEIRRLGPIEWVLSVAFSPNGQILAIGSEDDTIHLWQVSSGTEIRQLKDHDKAVSSVTFSPDGQILASGSSDNTVRLWQVSSGNEIRRLEGHTNSVWSVAFSPDGQTLASGSWDNTIRLWNVATGTCLAILGLLPEGWVAFSPDGRYKLGGIPAGGFWHAINLCRFEAGELDEWVPGLRLPDDASFLDLPPWTPQIQRPARLRRDAPG